MEDCQRYSDIEVLTRELKEGKEVAFDYLFRTRYKNLCRFAATFVIYFDVAEDIVQEVFEKIWKKSTRIDEEESIDSYLFVAVRNACFTFLKNKRERVDLEAVKQNLETPEEVIEFDTSELNRLWREIDNLPVQCKIVFKLVVLEDMKYKDVAESLDISINTVKTQMKIAYKTLREKLRQDQFSLLLLLFGMKEN
ncbi:RNA polymerase sigma-70 factor [Butyricimonas paravirosa]|uniref:RNA polymerase sigma-70 factor n=1 Tax=Butyricimonas paravirosa TaxID=1472417 RepID=UPI00210CF455|nr:RNA polymerase sigma-70 factor [Butyricimonas paravirosa]MCQ4872790.1 RNA polymerase sigma-70 factor [Butyricimonas paravirosa]